MSNLKARDGLFAERIWPGHEVARDDEPEEQTVMGERVHAPVWSGHHCALPGYKTVGRRTRNTKVFVNLSGYSLHPKSLLVLSIEQAAWPHSDARLYKFKRAVQELVDVPRAVAILNSSPNELTSSAIAELFKLIEDQIEKSWGKKSAHTASQHARNMFRTVQTPLIDGSRAADSGFSSRFPQASKIAESAAHRNLSLDGITQDFINPGYKSPESELDTISNFHSFEERNKVAYKKSYSKNEEIANYCLISFAHHERMVGKIKAAKAMGAPNIKATGSRHKADGIPTRERFCAMQEEGQLRFLVDLWEEHSFHIAPKEFSISLPLTGLNSLVENKFIDSRGHRQELLLCDYYLPHHIIGACSVAIQNETGVNGSVIEGLTKKDVVRTKNGFKILGIKTRTDQEQGKAVGERSLDTRDDLPLTGEAAVKAMDLLLNHAENIENLLGHTYIPLLTAINRKLKRGPLQIAKVGAYKLGLEYCKFHNIRNFDTLFLRKLRLQTQSLSAAGGVYSAQGLAGHSEASTTNIYVLTNVMSHLYMANIRRFMDMIAGSILWTTNRHEQLAKSDLDKRGFNLQLLFPLEGDDYSEESVIDSWINSDFTRKINIGLDELRQCASQHSFYKTHIDILQQQNPRKFAVSHIPRILSCLALHEVILSSTYAFAYRKIAAEFQ